MRVLTVNVGSSSQKVALVEDGQLVREWDRLPDPVPAVDAVGHRIVHGGKRFTEPVLVDQEVLDELHRLTELAPLHQPPALHALADARRLLPDVPHVACFDTAFHATLPAAAATYAVPARWRELGAHRYGFHGLSHAWASRRARELVPGARRIVSCHLGSGCSLAAVLDGVSVDTTMGFTPLDGLVMATRSGSVDPGLLVWLLTSQQVPAQELGDALEHSSGLRGLAGTADVGELLARRDPEALLAVQVFLHRLSGMVAAMTTALAGLDVLLFTGGIGEHAPTIRAATAESLGYLGVSVDPGLNWEAAGQAEISAAGAAVRTLVIPAREDLEIARGVAGCLAAGETSGKG